MSLDQMGAAVSGAHVSAKMSESIDPVWESKQYLLDIIMTQCKITREDLRNTDVVRSKVRESKIEMILS